MAEITDINKNKDWVDIGQKLLTPELKEKLIKKILKEPNDNINQPAHYQGKTLELTDVYQDFFEADDSTLINTSWTLLNTQFVIVKKV